MWAGIPCVPISLAYSHISGDVSTLRRTFGFLTSRLIFVLDAKAFAAAIDIYRPVQMVGQLRDLSRGGAPTVTRLRSRGGRPARSHRLRNSTSVVNWIILGAPLHRSFARLWYRAELRKLAFAM